MRAVRSARLLLVALAIVGLAFLYLASLYPRQQAPHHSHFDLPAPWVVAHRGGAALAPENTLEAFRRARALGVDVLEMDLRVTADGAFAVIHDPTVDRTTNGHGRVVEMTLDELQSLDAGARFGDEGGNTPFAGRGIRVPAFGEVLRHFPDIRFNVEMKEFTTDQARALCALLRGHDSTGRVLVSSFPHEPMEAFREACPEVPTGATRREVVVFDLLHRAGLGRVFRSPALTLQVPLRFRGREVLTPTLVERARASRRPVQAWIVNDEAEMTRCLDLGVQAIITDRPDRLLALLRRRPRGPGSAALTSS
jgi:glycerophosphoryl diester phosphodiesterase